MIAVSFESVWQYLLCSYSALCGGGESLGSCYLQYDSLTIACAFCAIFIAYRFAVHFPSYIAIFFIKTLVIVCIHSFIWSILGWNASKVDQLWSITPVLYTWHFYVHYRVTGQTRGHHDRLLVVCVLVTLWGARLTYNFWKKGG
ncbi:DUF1295 domain-containing protein [archaeon]|nr:MAG: DUF1295 domain-containing protein [archaeon]